MPNTISSQYMGLPVPVVGTDPGPDWATDLNTSLTTIDQHDHSSGKGTQVIPSGLNINSDLTFQSNNAIALRSVRFTAQSSPLGAAADLGCCYVSGVDFYFNDGNGNQIRLTASGSVAGTSGSIGGLVSPASVTYSAGTYVFKSTASISGNIDAGSVVVRETVASGKGVTLSAPTGLASNYTLTFPSALPASQKIVSIDSSGNIAAAYAVDNSTIQISSNTIQVKDAGIVTAKIADSAVTTAKIADSNVTYTKIAAPNFGVVAISVTSVTNGTATAASADISVAKGPYVRIEVVNGSASFYSNSSDSDFGTYYVTRDGVTLSGTSQISNTSRFGNPILTFVDSAATVGSHTYALKFTSPNAFSITGIGGYLTVQEIV